MPVQNRDIFYGKNISSLNFCAQCIIIINDSSEYLLRSELTIFIGLLFKKISYKNGLCREIQRI